MSTIPFHDLTSQLELADQLRIGREKMFEPQDLPGRYGRVVKALDHVLDILDCEAVVGGGWAVWRHGFLGRVTQNIDVVLPSGQVEEFLRVASLSGFQRLPEVTGRWPKLIHKETDILVDILPEGGRPGTPSRPAATTVPHPSQLGASGTSLRYINLPSLVELKIAAGRTQDLADIIRLIQANKDRVEAIREHLNDIHADYATAFDQLVTRAKDEAQ